MIVSLTTFIIKMSIVHANDNNNTDVNDGVNDEQEEDVVEQEANANAVSGVLGLVPKKNSTCRTSYSSCIRKIMVQRPQRRIHCERTQEQTEAIYCVSVDVFEQKLKVGV